MEDSFSDEVAQSVNTHQLKYPIIDWKFHSLKLIIEVMTNNMLEYFLSISSFFTSWLYIVYCGRIKFALSPVSNILHGEHGVFH